MEVASPVSPQAQKETNFSFKFAQPLVPKVYYYRNRFFFFSTDPFLAYPVVNSFFYKAYVNFQLSVQTPLYKDNEKR